MISSLGRPFALPIQVIFVKPSKAMNRPGYRCPEKPFNNASTVTQTRN
ncbi:MAG: hypothetical protein WBL44_07300 [Nitrososphaeraceae archaeon]